MLSTGADPNCKDHAGRTPVPHAAMRGSPPIPRVLTGAGAGVLFAQNDRSTTLHHAARSRSLAAVEYVLALGCIPNARNSWEQMPLLSAS
ncbi:MAG TPA: ankyrin repeat domain-containing protein, partial [Chthonomonadales bacterium]|nr:ankyrin repeat domain-containing protein [Chthonomonadales bacterium]